MEEGTLAELSFSVTSIADEVFRRRVTSQTSFMVLEENTTLMVALSDRGSAKPYAEFDAKHFPQGIPIGTSRWACVRLGPPKKKKGEEEAQSGGSQQALFPEAVGLWLKLKGLEKCELVSSTIEELAPMVSEWGDTLRVVAAPQARPAGASGRGRVASEDAEYTLLRQALGYDPVSIDGLTERTGLTVPVLSSMLLRMELEGEVVADPGGTYSRCAGSG